MSAEPRLATSPQDMVTRVEPKNDEVLVVFRNGALDGVFAPGDRASRLRLRLPIRPGALTYARILRSDIKVECPVRRVLLRNGEWTLPSVHVTAFIALNPANDYAALKARLRDRGLGFFEAVASQLEADVSAAVRTMFGKRTHEDVDGSPASTGDLLHQTLLHDLYVIDSVTITDVQPDPQYALYVENLRGMVVDQSANERASMNAGAQGQSLEEYLNPDRVLTREAQSFELARQQMELQHAAALQAQQAAHERALAAIEERKHTESLLVESDRIDAARTESHLRTDAEVRIAAIQNASSLDRLASRGHESLVTSLVSSPSQPAGQQGDLSPLTLEGELVDAVAPPATLPVDPAVRDVLVEAGITRRTIRGALRRTGSGSGSGSDVVLLVTDQARPAVGTLATQLFPDAEVVLLSATDSVSDWVLQLVHRRVPGSAEAQVSVSLHEESEGELALTIGVPAGRPGPWVKRIAGQESMVRALLMELLSYDALDVR